MVTMDERGRRRARLRLLALARSDEPGPATLANGNEPPPSHPDASFEPFGPEPRAPTPAPRHTLSARAKLVANHSGDPAVIAVARAVAVQHSTGFGEQGRVVDIFGPLLSYLTTTLGFDDAVRKVDAELGRIAKVLIKLGLVEKSYTTKNGKRAVRYVLPRVDLPTHEELADVVIAEMRADRRMEASFRDLVARSPGLALMGLEGERAALALQRAGDFGTLQISYLVGSPRVLNPST